MQCELYILGDTCDKFVSIFRRNKHILFIAADRNFWVNESIVKLVLVRKTCACFVINPTLFFHLYRA